MAKQGKGKGKGDAPADARVMRLSQHPRARGSIRRAKSGAGLGAFLLVGLLSLRAGLPVGDAALRALGGGVAAYFLGWFVAVTVWRHLALAELEAARARREQRLAALKPSDDA